MTYYRKSHGPTCDDDVDGELDLPVWPGGRDGDVVPRVLLGKELQRASPSRRLVRVLQAVTVPAKYKLVIMRIELVFKSEKPLLSDLVLGSMVSGGLLGATLSFSGQWFRSALSIFELAFWLSLQVMPNGSQSKKGDYF